MVLLEGEKRTKKRTKKTYNTGDSLVVTDPTTSPALRSLCTGERTGPSIFYELWSYVLTSSPKRIKEASSTASIRQVSTLFRAEQVQWIETGGRACAGASPELSNALTAETAL